MQKIVAAFQFSYCVKCTIYGVRVRKKTLDVEETQEIINKVN